jgi:hypothetical protein
MLVGYPGSGDKSALPLKADKRDFPHFVTIRSA